MEIREELRRGRFYLDGGMGTMLQSRGLAPGEAPDRWNLTHAEDVIAVHKAYFDAGSNMVCTNTFGANALKFAPDELEAVVRAAVRNARTAAERSEAPQRKFVALDLGPLGRLLKPYGDLDFEDAVAAFAATVRIGAACGVDCIVVETMNDSYETKAAVLAARENSDLPVIASNAYGEDGKLMTGANAAAMVAMLEGLGVAALGANCSLGPQQLTDVMRELLDYASVPVLCKPNAGMPRRKNGETVYDVTPAEFAAQMSAIAQMGVPILGGCCGTTPEYLAHMIAATRDIPVLPVTEKDRTLVSSYTHAVELGGMPLLIGERINPTGKKLVKQAILDGDVEYLLREGLEQEERGAHILDVNVGLPGIDEPAVLTRTVQELQAVTALPLQLDTADPAALERAMRRYNGKPMVNSVNGKAESMRAVFPLVKKYGGVVVALTLDEGGIPPTAEGRVAIAEKILREAERYGVAKKDIVFDTLCMAASADTAAPAATLDALRTLHEQYGARTVLGVSNVSFGLPQRESVNAAMFLMALENGLSAGIVNPRSQEMQKVYHSFLLLRGYDENCGGYLAFAETLPAPAAPSAASAGAATAKQELGGASALQEAIIKGLKERAATLTEELLRTVEPMKLINEEVIPALDVVGRGFEEKRVYLPQLLMSAEAAKNAFERIKAAMPAGGAKNGKRIVLATVHGDVHDIGKNIVRVLLENYGYAVTDLGKDVPAETIVEAVRREGAAVCGLSALMTTTVPAMEETIRRLRATAPDCRIVVGGAVLTREYAEQIGADKYARDAMETVRYAEALS